MDHERIELLSRKLCNPRIETRLRTANNILFKLESGILMKDEIKSSSSIGVLLEGIVNSFAFIMQSSSENDLTDNTKENYHLLSLLISIVHHITKVPFKSSLVNPCTNVLNNLYQLKTIQNLDTKLLSLIDEAIASICSLGEIKESLELNDELLHSNIYTQSETDLHVPNLIYSNNKIGTYHGAGAILNSRLVYNGWKFPDFVITDHDERYIFDVEVRVKLQHESASRDIWDLLANFPVQAILQKTNLLHSVLDIVGVPFSKRDIDANPEGLNPLIALKWLEVLMLKCHLAFSAQLDGTMYCRNNNEADKNRDDSDLVLDIPDVSMKLAQAMYSLRHPILPVTKYQSNIETKLEKLGNLALLPLPSYPGLAFACSAAAMPLLQTRDPDIARSVYSLLKVALPYILEPNLKSDQEISDVEYGRFQHLLNRLEQIFSFFGSHFDFENFLALVYSEDHEGMIGTEINDKLKDNCFNLIFLATVVLIFESIPSKSILPQSELDDGLNHKIKIGSCTRECLYKMLACKSLWKFLPSNTEEVLLKTLYVLDKEFLLSANKLHQVIQCSELFLSSKHWLESPYHLIEQLVTAAEMIVELFDENCNLCNSAVLENAKLSLCSFLPILLIACEDEEPDSDEGLLFFSRIVALFSRIFSCSTLSFKSHLVRNILMYVQLPSHSKVSQEYGNKLQIEIAYRLGVDPVLSHHFLTSKLAIPPFMHALMVLGYYQIDLDSAADQDIFLNLLNYLSKYLITSNLLYSIPDSSLLSWAQLLPPLKLLEWNNSTLPSALADFTRLLHDRCALCSCSESKLIFSKCLIMGLFHINPRVRISSVLSIQRDLFDSPVPVGSVESIDMVIFDIFSKQSHIQLNSISCFVEDLNHQQTDLRKLKKNNLNTSSLKAVSKVSFTHGDIRKVATIGCNQSLDASVRISALTQMMEMLTSDDQLLRTADLSWITMVTKESLETMIKLMPFEFKMSSSMSTIDKLRQISDCDCRLLIIAMKVVIYLISNVKALKDMMSFYNLCNVSSSSSSSIVSVQILLKLLLVQDITNSKVIDNTWSQTLQILRYLSAQLFFILCCSADNWFFNSSKLEGFEMIYRFHLQKGIESAKENEFEGCFIPSFVFQTLLYPSSKYVSTTNEYHRSSLDAVYRNLSKLKQVKIICQNPHSNNCDFPIADISRIILSDVTFPTVDRIYVATCTKSFGMIVDAQSHIQLREALSTVLCIFDANSVLLRVFLDLKISLITAVSNIITINPRTHKDHVTLSSVISFLNSMLQSLISIYGMNFTNVPECQNFIQEILDVVLPNVAIYLKKHGRVSSPSPSTHYDYNNDISSEKEYINVTSYVVTAYLKLLLTITSLRDPEKNLQLAELLSGNYSMSYIFSLSCSELHSAWDRYLAISILNNLVSLHNGYEIVLQCASETTDTLGFSATSESILLSRTSDGVKIQNHCDSTVLLESLVRMIRLLRTPDSMIGTSVLVSGLKLLYLCLFNSCNSNKNLFHHTSKRYTESWSWLVRLLYDRRTEVKLLSLEIINLVLDRYCVEDDVHFAVALDISADSLEDFPKHSSKDESSSSYAWPPFDVLNYIILDNYESVSLRSKAADILVHQLIHKNLYKSSEIKLGNILTFVNFCLSLDQDISNSISIQWALDFILKLFTSAHPNIRDEMFPLMRSLKIPKKIIELMDSSMKEYLIRAALGRVEIKEENYISFHKDAYNHLEKFAISKHQIASNHLELEGNGWNHLQQMMSSLDQTMMKSIKTSICCFFFQLNKIGPDLLSESIKYSNIIFLCFTNFSELDEMDFKVKDNIHDWIYNLSSINAQVELLSLFIADHSLVLEKVIGESELIPINVLRSIALTFENMIEITRINEIYHQLELVITQCISSCLRLLNILLHDETCRIYLGLSDVNSSMLGILKYLFLHLIEFRSSDLFKLSSDPTKMGLRSRIDLTIAHFMQYNVEARSLFIAASCKQRSDHQTAGNRQEAYSAVSLFHQYILTIEKFVDLSSNLGSDSLNDTTEIQKSLHNLKMKSMVDSTKKKLNQSTSSLGSITSTSSNQNASKWRIKNRSYVWNSNREEQGQAGSSFKATSNTSNNISPLMKLQVWSALIVLSCCFPDCKEAVDLAIDSNLHFYLSKLLRYANRYTLSTALNFISPIREDCFQDINDSGSWIPSNGMVSAAICSLCCSFSFEHLQAKLNFACSGEASAASINESSQGNQPTLPISKCGSSLHQLVAIGTSRSSIPVIRWLCLSLAGSLLSCSRSVTLGNPALKSTFTQIFILSLQRSMHASSSDPESLLYLLNALTCLLSSDEDISNLVQLCSKENSTQLQLSLALIKETNTKASDVSIGSFKLMTFPELMHWVWSKTRNENNVYNNELIAAICRCLGRISVIDKKNKTIGNILSESMFSILCDCFQVIDNSSVMATSAVSLWNIVHHSEKAKCIVKEQLRRNTQKPIREKENSLNNNIMRSNSILVDTDVPVAQAKLYLDSLSLA